MDQFAMWLKRIAKQCEFKDEEEMLRDKMVFGLKDNSVKEKLFFFFFFNPSEEKGYQIFIGKGNKMVKEKLLTRDNLKLKEAIDIARTAEASKRQVKLMSAKTDKKGLFGRKSAKKSPF